MLTEVKTVVEIAKFFRISSSAVTHIAAIVVASSVAITGTLIFSAKNDKIESVPEIKKSIEVVNVKMDSVINSVSILNNNLKNMGIAISEKIKVDSVKFSKIPVLNEDKFSKYLDDWWNRNYSKMLQGDNTKKNFDRNLSMN